MYTLSFSIRFQRQLAKLVKSDPGLKSQVKKTVTLLESNLKHPSLRFHKLSGENYWSISVNRSIRILAVWNDNKFYLLGIGSHDEVY